MWDAGWHVVSACFRITCRQQVLLDRGTSFPHFCQVFCLFPCLLLMCSWRAGCRFDPLPVHTTPQYETSHLSAPSVPQAAGSAAAEPRPKKSNKPSLVSESVSWGGYKLQCAQSREAQYMHCVWAGGGRRKNISSVIIHNTTAVCSENPGSAATNRPSRLKNKCWNNLAGGTKCTSVPPPPQLQR